MGWTTACVFVNQREEGFLGTFPAHHGKHARELLDALGWEFEDQSQPSQFDAGLEPPSGWFCVGSYDGASLLSGHPELYGVVQDLEKHLVQRCLSVFPDAQVLFWELDEGTGLIAYALYDGANLQRAFLYDPDEGVVINEGDLQPEEKTVLGNSPAEQISEEVAEPLLFALTARFLGSPFNKYQAEKLPTELFKQKRSWWKR
jgi:uncharacterized protein DUF6928